MYRCYRLAALGIGVCMMCGCTPSTPELAPVAQHEETKQTEVANADVKDETEFLPTRIQEVHWKLIGVEGKAVIALAGEREAYLILKLENRRLQGFGGCNILLGTYTLDETSQRVGFDKVASTMMACPRLQDERDFLNALSKAQTYKIEEGVLLLQKEGKTLLSFEAVL
ncbi:META domain-containing protein [Sulfurospirillum cavolei]|uniref:META domain-containing protein n=1 Tax=Sulfurospirillum cavolei TaxID=366522 RepID=UPI0006940B08|nr:META domain-containing protein [Sulfurospirillum cavolei]